MTIHQFIFGLVALIAIGEGFWIFYLLDQLHQRNGYVRRVHRELDKATNEAKRVRAMLRSSSSMKHDL